MPQGEAAASAFFSPKVTLATTKSPLPWDGQETPRAPEGVRGEFAASGILILTQALPALQPSPVRSGQTVLVWPGVSPLSEAPQSRAAAAWGLAGNCFSGWNLHRT